MVHRSLSLSSLQEENIQHGQALLHPSLLPQGTVQVQNVSQGVIVSGESLVLQKVRRDKAGKYKCGASNALATVTSAPVHLKIRCECSEPLMYGFEYPIEESVCNLYLTESILELATACYISLSGPLLSVYYIILN